MPGDDLLDSPLGRSLDMWRQHLAWEREGYDGHNRRSGLLTMHRIRLRVLRRRWNQRMYHMARGWSAA